MRHGAHPIVRGNDDPILANREDVDQRVAIDVGTHLRLRALALLERTKRTNNCPPPYGTQAQISLVNWLCEFGPGGALAGRSGSAL